MRSTRNEAKFSMQNYTEPENVLVGVFKPQMVTKDYVARLVRFTQCSPAAFTGLLIYLDRVAIKRRRLILTLYNMHRLTIAGLTLACKNLMSSDLLLDTMHRLVVSALSVWGVNLGIIDGE